MNRLFPFLLALLVAVPAFAADPLPMGAKNMLIMEGVSPTFDLTVEYGENFMQVAKVGDQTYDIAMYFDPSGVETLIPNINEALKVGDLETFNYDEVRIWLGNLNDPGQRKSMPLGEYDMDKKVVVFRNVKLKPGEMIRVNLPCKFYKQGQEVVLNNKTGPLGAGYGWGWIPENGSAVTGTAHNGIRFLVNEDGTLTPKPFKAEKKPLP